jgi:CBS domain-containing protein
MHKIPIDIENPPNLILDLIYNLKIKEVMTREVLTASRLDSLRKIQKLMRENQITGVPITEDRKLVGIVSTDDIIQALDGGYINSPAWEYMTSDLKILEDDMPLSYGISFFRKFKFSRFPVINKNRNLVGIITAGDIVSALLVETNRLVQTLESKISVAEPIPYRNSRHLNYPVQRHDFENAGKASSDIKKILKAHNIDTRTVRRVAVAAYELEMNMTVHSIGGTLEIMIDEEKVVITSKDKGPGIESTEKALQEGYSTANDWIRSLGFGAGMGLPNIRRVSDEFSINSVIADGTIVQSIIYFNGKENTNEAL